MLKEFDLSRLIPSPFRSMARKKRGRTFNMEAALQKFHSLKQLPEDQLDERVNAAIEAGRHRKMSPEEREAQLVSFVWGNAPEGNQGTRETVRKNLGRLAKV